MAESAPAASGLPTPELSSDWELSTLALGALKRQPAFAPGGVRYQELVQKLLPTIYGGARTLLDGDETAAREAVQATFATFALRWRRISRGTLVVAWLFRTLTGVVRQQRKRLGPAPAAGSSAPLEKWLGRLDEKTLSSVLLAGVLGMPLDAAARALRHKPRLIARRVERATQRLDRILKKPGGTAARELLGAIRTEPPPEMAAAASAVKAEDPSAGSVEQLVRGAVWFWRRLWLARAARRVFATVGTAVLTLFLFGGVMSWLHHQGYLNAWGIRNSQRGLVKQFPELAQPARPWPGTAEAAARLTQDLPKTTAELYRLTNIFPATLRLPAAQWKKISPSAVPPVNNSMNADGTMTLRNPNAKRSGLAGVIGLEFNWVHGELEFAGNTFANVAVRYRGNGTFINSLYGPKQSFKVDLNKYKKGQGIGGVDELNFLNSIADMSYVRDSLAHQLFQDLGATAPRTAYAYLTLDVPGHFTNQALGLYVLLENVDSDFARARFGTKDVPIFKPVTPQLFEDLGPNWKAYADIYDLKTEATGEQLQRIVKWSEICSQADDAEFSRQLGNYFDLEELAAFIASNVLLSSYDGFLSNGQNFYLYMHPQTHKMGFVSWDQDHSWGEFGYIGSAEERERASIWNPATYDFKFLRRVMKDEGFRTLYRQKLESALATQFTEERLFAQVDELAGVIRPAIQAESDFRARRFEEAVSSKWSEGPRDNAGPPEGPAAPVHQIKRFISARIHSVRAQLDGKEEGSTLVRRW